MSCFVCETELKFPENKQCDEDFRKELPSEKSLKLKCKQAALSVHLMRRILSVPEDDLKSYVVEKDPSEWVKFCKQCKTYVASARKKYLAYTDAFTELQTAERELREIFVTKKRELSQVETTDVIFQARIKKLCVAKHQEEVDEGAECRIDYDKSNNNGEVSPSIPFNSEDQTSSLQGLRKSEIGIQCSDDDILGSRVSSFVTQDAHLGINQQTSSSSAHENHRCDSELPNCSAEHDAKSSDAKNSQHSLTDCCVRSDATPAGARKVMPHIDSLSSTSNVETALSNRVFDAIKLLGGDSVQEIEIHEAKSSLEPLVIPQENSGSISLDQMSSSSMLIPSEKLKDQSNEPIQIVIVDGDGNKTIIACEPMSKSFSQDSILCNHASECKDDAKYLTQNPKSIISNANQPNPLGCISYCEDEDVGRAPESNQLRSELQGVSEMDQPVLPILSSDGENLNEYRKSLRIMSAEDKDERKCDICNSSISGAVQLSDHIRKCHKGNNRYVCPEPGCGKEIPLSTLFVHKEEEHNPEAKRFLCQCGALVPETLRGYHFFAIFHCLLCSKTIRRQGGTRNMLYHQAQAHGLFPNVRKELECEHCQKIFSSRKDKAIHMSNMHMVKSKSKSQLFLIRCTEIYCDFFAQTYDQIADHLRHIHSVNGDMRCPECNEMVSKANYLEHSNGHNDKISCEKSACPTCKETFPRRYVLTHFVRQHQELQSVEKPASPTMGICYVCGIPCDSIDSLKSHLLEMHNEVIVEEQIESAEQDIFSGREGWKQAGQFCSFCFLHFDQDTDFKTHMKCHDMNGATKCLLCKKVCANKSLLQHYEKGHMNVKVYKVCNLCNLKLEEVDLNRHMKDIHDIDIKMIEDGSGGSGGFVVKQSGEVNKCQECDRVFSSEKAMETHVLNYHRSKKLDTIQCEHCSFRCKGLESMAKHRRNVHNLTGSVPCPHCGRQVQHARLHFHILAEHSEGDKTYRRVFCHLCGAFIPEVIMQYHMDEVHPTPKNSCDICSKRFFHGTAKDILYHKARKHGLFPELLEELTCSVCKKVLYAPKEVQRHIDQVHVKDYVCKCKDCGIGFQSFGKLRKHNLEREVERIRCPICSQTFCIGAHIDKHIKEVHPNEKPFKCNKCDMPFSKWSGPRRHQKVHERSEEEKIQCKVCNAEFLSKHYLKIHLRHKEKQGKSHGSPSSV